MGWCIYVVQFTSEAMYSGQGGTIVVREASLLHVTFQLAMLLVFNFVIHNHVVWKCNTRFSICKSETSANILKNEIMQLSLEKWCFKGKFPTNTAVCVMFSRGKAKNCKNERKCRKEKCKWSSRDQVTTRTVELPRQRQRNLIPN